MYMYMYTLVAMVPIQMSNMTIIPERSFTPPPSHSRSPEVIPVLISITVGSFCLLKNVI